METIKKSVTLESELQENNPGSMRNPESATRTSSAGIKLIPQPSDDPKDPLVCPDPVIKLAKVRFR